MPTNHQILASALVQGDLLLTAKGYCRVTHIRKNRRYPGYLAIQFAVGEHINQIDIRPNEVVTVQLGAPTP